VFAFIVEVIGVAIGMGQVVREEFDLRINVEKEFHTLQDSIGSKGKLFCWYVFINTT
jgi:hypothetical protein